MKKIAIIFLAALTAVSLTACKQQSDDTQTQVSVPESSIQSLDESVTESSQESEPVSVSDVSIDESIDESSIFEFIPPEKTTINDYQYMVINDKCRLMLYTGTETRVVVPPAVTIDGKEYETEIGAGCFKETNITTLDLPENITEIPESMCEDCRQLTSVSFWNVKTIGKKAFWQCEKWKFSLDDLNNGNKGVLKKIGEWAFGLSGLYGKVTITPDMELSEGAFQICEHISEVEVESGVTVIPERLFSENRTLEKITLPETVTKIGLMAFFQSNVESIIIPQSVTEIGKGMISTYMVSGGKYTGIMFGYKGTAAEEYANENGIIFSPLD